MTARTCRYTADWVLPVALPPIRAGAVIVGADGTIQGVGPDAALPAAPHEERIDLGRAALLPGLVNVHAHPELALFRGLLEDRPFHEWIPALMRVKQRAAEEAPVDFPAAARWTCVEALAAGITTIGATEDSGAALDAFLEAGLRGVVYREVFGPDPAAADGALARFAGRVDEMRARETDLVRVGVSPHAPYSVSARLFRLIADYALAERLPVAVHTAESEVETLLVRDGTGPFAAGLRARGFPIPPTHGSTIALLEECRILETRPLLIHCVQLAGDDIHRIAAADAAVAHCPIANARLGHGIAPVVELLEAGVRVGLGTDSVASNNRLDLLEEARTAQLVQRARLRSADALPARDLLRLATLDGARALGLADRIGSLEEGKDADLCAVALDAPHVVPVHDPVAALIHAARGSDVILTAVRGRVLYRLGRHATLDAAGLRERITAEAARLRAAAS
jgi:cytosine/adenosine deaminase-related metal-dependent hydrolase